MLIELAITNFAIIQETRITLQPGFNAITGETGAGKSILIDALGAVLGERVTSDVVRTGEKSARIEATFDLSEMHDRPDLKVVLGDFGIDTYDDVLILSREISASGRGTARINGRSATAGMVQRIGSLLVDIHGQSDHLSLLRPAEQLSVLDRFAGTGSDREHFAERLGDLRDIRERIADIAANSRTRAQRIDLLTFQAGEISAASLAAGEDDALVSERRVLANAEQLMQDASLVQTLLQGDDEAFQSDIAPSAIGPLRQASDALAGIEQIDSAAGPMAERLAEVVILLEDLVSEVRTYRETVEGDPGRLAEIEERLDLIKSLKRKYGSSIGEILATAEAATAELATLTGDKTDLTTLTKRERSLSVEVGRLAFALSLRRRAAAETLAAAVERAIAELNMGRAVFSVDISQVSDLAGVPFADGDPIRHVAVERSGADRVTFLLAPHSGETPKPLARVASGGETARLMLALKSILSAADSTPTLVFDEVDVGVGSRSGQVVGEKLWGLTENHQVIVITHLPQIAAFADTHFRILKADHEDRVVSRVTRVDEIERLDELAAMLDGEPVTEASKANAQAMLKRVDDWKRARSGAETVMAT